MPRTPDFLSGDMFPAIPKPARLDAGAMDLNVRIAHAMSGAMKACPHDRYEIAARMSRILQPREITKNMLDAYAAASKDTHIPNLAFCIAFDMATEQKELLNLYAALLGCGVLVGDETLRAELLRLQDQEAALRNRKRAIQNFLRGRR